MFTGEFTADDGTDVVFEWSYSRHDGLAFGKFTHYQEDDRPRVLDSDDVPQDWRDKAHHVAERSLHAASVDGWRV